MSNQLLNSVQPFATSRIVALQAPLSMGSPRQEYWSELPLPAPGDLSNSGIEPVSPTWQVDFLPLSQLGSTLQCISMLAYEYESH